MDPRMNERWMEERERLDRQYRAQTQQMYNTQMIRPGMLTTTGGNGMMIVDWVGSHNSDEPTSKEKIMAGEVMGTIKDAAVALEVKSDVKVSKHADRLKKLGFENLHKGVAVVAERAMKENLVALAGYKKIPEAKLREAGDKIRAKSNGRLRLAVTPIDRYMGQHAEEGMSVNTDTIQLPPEEALTALEKAQKEGLFDSYSIIHVQKAPDPILIGHIKGINDTYFIAEWGDDIKLSEILA